MAGIGDLVANLSVDSSGFSKGLSGATGSLSSFTSGSVAKLAAFAAGTAAVLGSIYALKSSISELAGVADQSAQTGLSGKFIQQLGYAADQSGVSAETMTKSIAKMTVGIGKASMEGGAAEKAFADIGVSMSDLAGMSREDQFMLISNQLAKIPDDAQRAAAAMEIFGKSGAELGPMLSSGAVGIQALMDQAGGLGIGLSEEEIANASAADDAMSRLSASVGAIIDKTAAQLAPAFTAVANAVTTLMPVIGSVIESIVGGFGTMGSFFAAVIDGIVTVAVTGLSLIEFGWNNMGEIAELASVSAQLSMVRLYENIAHFFTATLPEYFAWFGENWFKMFETAGNFVGTVFLNIAANIMNAWDAIIAYISGDEDALSNIWTPLTEGFTNTVAELPDIPDRAITELEKSLQKDADRLGLALGNNFSATLGKNMKLAESTKNLISGAIPSGAQELDMSNGAGAKTEGGKSSSDVKFSGALAQGSQEAYSAIVNAMRGSESNREQKEQTKALKDIAKNTKPKAANAVVVVEAF